MRFFPVVVALTLACGLFWGAQAQEGEFWGGPGSAEGPDGGEFGPQPAMLLGGGPAGRIRDMGPRREGRGLDFFLKHREALGLSEEQVRKIKDIRLNTVKKVSELRSGLQVGQLELRDMLDSDQVDLSQVEGKLNSVGQIRSKIAFALTSARVETKRVLSAEQLEKAKSLGREERGPGQPRRPGFMRRMRPGPGPGQESEG